MLSTASTLFLVQLLHTSLSYFISTLLLALFAQLLVLMPVNFKRTLYSLLALTVFNQP